jgi:hypothetical protein
MHANLFKGKCDVSGSSRTGVRTFRSRSRARALLLHCQQAAVDDFREAMTVRLVLRQFLRALRDCVQGLMMPTTST